MELAPSDISISHEQSFADASSTKSQDNPSNELATNEVEMEENFLTSSEETPKSLTENILFSVPQTTGKPEISSLSSEALELVSTHISNTDNENTIGSSTEVSNEGSSEHSVELNSPNIQHTTAKTDMELFSTQAIITPDTTSKEVSNTESTASQRTELIISSEGTYDLPLPSNVEGEENIAGDNSSESSSGPLSFLDNIVVIPNSPDIEEDLSLIHI